MLGILTAVLGTVGAVYYLVKIKCPWLSSDIRLLKMMIGVGRHVTNCQKTNTLPIDIFEQTVDKYNEKPMIIYKDQSYSFTQVDKLANKVANVALSLGLKRGDTVAIMMYNEPTFVWSYIGFEKIGVEVAFINFHQRQKALLHSIITSDAKAIFLSQGPELYASIEDIVTDLEQIDLYTFESAGSGVPSRFKSLSADLQSAAEDRISRDYRSGITTSATNCLIFTSGTTGLPKPAIVTHLKSIVGSNVFTYCNATADDILYESLPLYHSAGSLLGLGTARSKGITLVLAEGFSSSKFLDECRRYKVTMIHYVGEMCRYLVNTSKTKFDTDHNIRVALGNGLRKDIWVEFRDRFQINNITEFYAATELPFGCVNVDNKVGAVGRITPLLKLMFPIAFVKYDTDADHPCRNAAGRCEKAATGEPGLLIIKVDKRLPFEGYKNKEEATKRKILHDVFKSGDAYVNSGDLFYCDGDHYNYFYDRTGDTFRWKGENVSTTEVANVISELPFISDTCVYGVTVPGCEGRAGMAAINLADSEKKHPTDEMIISIGEKCVKDLANYAIPRFIRFRQVLDMTSTFKQQKSILKKEGFDPDLLHEPLFYFDLKNQRYCFLDREILKKINNQELKL